MLYARITRKNRALDCRITFNKKLLKMLLCKLFLKELNVSSQLFKSGIRFCSVT